MGELSVEAICWPGDGSPGEDRLVLAGRVAAVIDGAGSPVPLVIDGLSGGAWIAQFLARGLAALDPDTADPGAEVLALNARVARELAHRGVDTSAADSAPAASFVAALWSADESRIRLVQTGDCLASTRPVGEDVRLLVAPQQAPWSAELRDLTEELGRLGASETDVTVARNEVRVRHRGLMNRPDGYGTFAGDPGLELHLVQVDLDAGPLVLASDGLHDGDPESLAAALEAPNLQAFAAAQRVRLRERGEHVGDLTVARWT